MYWKDLANHSRVWIYQANRELSRKEVEEIRDLGKSFISNWAAHGKSLEASFEVFYNRFLVVFADEEKAKASGCSIDASVHFIQEIEKKYSVDLFDRMKIAYMNKDSVDTIDFNSFKEEFQKGIIQSNTLVFNNLVENLKQFKESWILPIEKSWHKQLI